MHLRRSIFLYRGLNLNLKFKCIWDYIDILLFLY